MSGWIAAKELTSVEVDPKRSHQHEFHAGRLRQLLGFQNGRVSGELLLSIARDNHYEPIIDEGTYTLYDAREAIEGRSEWHLYYSTNAIGAHARAGDLLVIYRSENSTALRALILRPGTAIERAVRHALHVGDRDTITRFIGITPTVPSFSEAQLLLQLPGPETAHQTLRPRDLRLFKDAVKQQSIPGGRAMAEGARELVESAFGAHLTADRYLELALEAESELFFAIEKQIGDIQLKEIVKAGGDFTVVMDFALRKSQARRSRRGQSLQNHVETLLKKYGVPNSPQCETERGEKPDFIIPACEAYHNADVSPDHLRMVGCKSRIRDRWRQYLNEAARIPVKHHISVDEDLSDEVLRAMHANGLRICMPLAIADRTYGGRDVRSLIMSIEELITELRSVTVGSN